MKYYVKNMRTASCGLIVMAELDKAGIQYNSVKIGQVDLNTKLTDAQCEKLKACLVNIGFELLGDSKSIIVENVKRTIYETIRYNDKLSSADLSDYLSWKTDNDYPYLSYLFSKDTGITIERFFIHCKMEYAKEMLDSCKYNVSEIAEKLNYRNVSNFSSQFKKSNGLLPSEYRKTKSQRFAIVHV